MKEISRFLKIKRVSIIIFIIYLAFLYASLSFGFDKNYVLYISLVSIFLFVLSVVISYLKYRDFSRKLLYWARDPSQSAPYLIRDSEFSKIIEKTNKTNKEISDSYAIKMRDFKDYITMWTHQIKTPLFSISLILNDHPVDSHAAKLEVFQIEEYIDSLLSYMRLESLSTDFLFEKLSLDDLISTSIKKYALVFIKKKNRVNFNPTNLLITSDKKWFCLILEQILSNSNKYTNNGEISIYMRGNDLVIEDTGIGIREEDLPRVFDKSYTGYNGRIYKKSTGIGLNLVKITANNLSIGVSIDSKIGKGTRLILDLSKIID